MVDLGNIAGD